MPGVSVGARTGWPGVGILWLDEIASLIYSFCLTVVARRVVDADLSLIIL